VSQPVVDYEATWNAKENKGAFVLVLPGNKKAKFKADDSSEFLAILSLLQGEKTVFARPPYLSTRP
jgi:hypothetical protein